MTSKLKKSDSFRLIKISSGLKHDENSQSQPADLSLPHLAPPISLPNLSSIPNITCHPSSISISSRPELSSLSISSRPELSSNSSITLTNLSSHLSPLSSTIPTRPDLSSHSSLTLTNLSSHPSLACHPSPLSSTILPLYSLPASKVEPMYHHQPVYDNHFYSPHPGPGMDGEYSLSHAPESVHPLPLTSENYINPSDSLAQYHDYYSRIYNYESMDQDNRLYDYSLQSSKAENVEPSHSYRYHGDSVQPVSSFHSLSLQAPPLISSNPPVPPLHPSPAVLLHIKYVMESVCETMSFTDITIFTASETLRAHQCILAAHSSFLKYLLANRGFSDTDGDDPVLFFPNYPSLYVRMLLQFFYTGEVINMTQRDIEPLRDICFSLGISSLMTRLDDVKLSISFQNIPSYDSHISGVAGSNATSIRANDVGHPSKGFKETLQHLDYEDSGQVETDGTHLRPQIEVDKPGEIMENIAKENIEPPKLRCREIKSSCKFEESREKTKHLLPKSSTDAEFPETSNKQYTVVSKMPKDTALQKNTKCPKCDLKFFKKQELEDHLKLHDGLKPKACSVCQKTFNSNYNLSLHMRIHSGNKPYSCAYDKCNKEFSDPSSLRRHLLTHTGEKPFTCKICQTKFSDRSTWRRHEASHANGSKFQCSICNKKFARRPQFRRHKLTVHKSDLTEEESKTKSDSKKEEINSMEPESGSKKDQIKNMCEECNAVFRKPSQLKIHMRVHSGDKPYKCNQCEKSFARKNNLQLHVRTHTGEKPHACAQCGRCFSDVSAFRRHCRTHSGERPYSCNECKASFTQGSTLYNHTKACHKKKRIKGFEEVIFEEVFENKDKLDGNSGTRVIGEGKLLPVNSSENDLL